MTISSSLRAAYPACVADIDDTEAHWESVWDDADPDQFSWFQSSAEP